MNPTHLGSGGRPAACYPRARRIRRRSVLVMKARTRQWVPGSLLVFLAACSANNPQGGNVFGGNGSASAGSGDFFATRVQPRLEYCRTCHVPGGVADTAQGHRMMLSSDKSQDLVNLEASWNALGGNNPVSRILLMASGQQSHSGGTPWPQGGTAYNDVKVQLECFEKPDQCASLIAGAGSPGPSYPLSSSATLILDFANQLYYSRANTSSQWTEEPVASDEGAAGRAGEGREVAEGLLQTAAATPPAPHATAPDHPVPCRPSNHDPESESRYLNSH
jgi:hypothetical protein